jgi:hypothetical protein
LLEVGFYKKYSICNLEATKTRWLSPPDSTAPIAVAFGLMDNGRGTKVSNNGYNMAKAEERAGRYVAPDITVLIDDWECDVINVSASGLLLQSDYLSFEDGNELQFTIVMPTSARSANIIMNGVVVRGDNNEFAIRNIAPVVTWQRLLARHVKDQAS